MKFTILVDPSLVIVTIRLFCMDQSRRLFNDYINFTPLTPKLPPLGGVSWNLQFLVSFLYICNILNLDKIGLVVSANRRRTTHVVGNVSQWDWHCQIWNVIWFLEDVLCHSGVDTAKHEMSYGSLETFCVTVGLLMPNVSVIWILGDVMCHSGCDNAKHACHMDPWRHYMSQWSDTTKFEMSYGSFETLCVTVGLTLPNVNVIWILGDIKCHSGVDTAKPECHMDPLRCYVSQWGWHCQMWVSYGSLETLCVRVGLTLPNVSVIWILGDVMCHSGCDNAKCECNMDPWRRYVSQWVWQCQTWMSYGSFEMLCVTVGLTLPNVNVIWNPEDDVSQFFVFFAWILFAWIISVLIAIFYLIHLLKMP